MLVNAIFTILMVGSIAGQSKSFGSNEAEENINGDKPIRFDV